MSPDRRPDRSPESLEARLRALPQPPVPAGLEARLLAGIPPGKLISPRRWHVWAGVAGALAAASLLAFLAWPRQDGQEIPSPGKDSPLVKAPPQGLDEAPHVHPWLSELPAFTWPLEETSPVTLTHPIPLDLLD